MVLPTTQSSLVALVTTMQGRVDTVSSGSLGIESSDASNKGGG